MSLRSSSTLGRRGLAAAGLAAAMVAAPGTAAAAPAAAASETEPAIAFLMSGANGQLTPETLFALPTITIPQEVRDAFQTFADLAMLPEGCVDNVADAIEMVLNGVIALPLELADALTGLLELLLDLGGEFPGLPGLDVLQDLLDDLLGLFPGAPEAPEVAATGAGTSDDPNADPPADEEVLEEGAFELPTVVQGLIKLGEALQGCIPSPPTPEQPEQPEKPEPVAPVVTEPTPQHPAPAPQTAQPVTYLGYAPTGAGTSEAADATVPLTALGGGLVLLAGAGAAGYGMRRRAVRTRD